MCGYGLEECVDDAKGLYRQLMDHDGDFEYVFNVCFDLNYYLYEHANVLYSNNLFSSIFTG